MLIDLSSKEYEPISKEEERILFTKYFETKNPKIREKILMSNYRFVMYIVRRYVKRPDQIEDYFSEGCIGLLKAFEKFTLDRDVKLISYAVFWIKQRIFLQFNLEKEQDPDDVIQFSLDHHNMSDENAETIQIEQTTFEDPEETRKNIEIKQLLDRKLSELSLMEQTALRMYHVNGISFEEIGKKYGMGHERARMMVRRTIHKLNRDPMNHIIMGEKVR
jgi:RNA polymerase sigma factor (sigma-70 family)